jgi:hypothetical protein
MASIVPTPVLDTRNGAQVAAQAVGALPPELSDRSDSNPAVVILEAAAYILDKDLYQINRWPQAVIQKALALVGITLNPAVAATVQQSFTLSSPQAVDTIIPKGTSVALVDGSIVFNTTADLDIPAYLSTPGGGTVAITSGSTAVVGSTTAFVTGSTWAGWQIQIPSSSGNWYTIASVSSTTSLTLTSAAVATASGQTYFVGPVTGTVAAQATTSGSATNVGAAKLTSLQSSPAGVASTSNGAAATGGSDLETTTAAIARASTAFSARDVACTASDYAYFAQQILGAGGRAQAQANTNVNTGANGYTTIALLSPAWTASAPVSAIERGSVVRDLASRTFTGSTTIDIAASIYQPTGPSVAVYRKAAFDAVTCQVQVAAALNTYLSPNTYPWGRIIYMPDLVKAVEAVGSVDRVHEINGVAAIGMNNATVPAAITFAASAGPLTTGSTSGFVAGQSFIIDAANNAVYLIVSFVANTSVTLDRAWTGATGASSPKFFTAKDDDGNGGSTSPLWYYLPFSNLSVSTSSPPASVVVVGAV